jgi:hypothetical protein
MPKYEHDRRDERDHGGAYVGGVEAGGGLAGIKLPPYIYTEIDADQTVGSRTAVYDASDGISLSVDLLLEDEGRVGTLVTLDAEAAEAIGEALLAAADVERTRAQDGIPAAVDDTLEGDDG